MRAKAVAGVGRLILALFFTSLVLVGQAWLSPEKVWGEDSSGIEEPARVKEITVKVALEGEEPSSYLVNQIEYSLAQVAENLLLHQRVEDVKQVQPLLEKTVKEVFDRALRGFTVKSVRLFPGARTELTLQLKPVGQVIHHLSLRVTFRGMHPRLAALIQEELRRYEDLTQAIFQGVPVASLEWGRFVLEPVLARELEAAFPGYTASVKGEYGEETKLEVVLNPVGEVVEKVRVNPYSYNLPGIIVSLIQAKLSREGELLQGIPVATLEKYRPRVEGMVKEVAEEKIFGTYGLRVQPSLLPGRETILNLELSSGRLRLETKGVLALGTNAAPDPVVYGRVGWLFLPPLEVWAELDLQTKPLALTPLVGLNYEASSATTLGVARNLTSSPGTTIFQLKHWLSPYQILRFKMTKTDASQTDYEWGFGARANDFVVVELVGDSQGNMWLQVVGNL